jgi:hypothetical protein
MQMNATRTIAPKQPRKRLKPDRFVRLLVKPEGKETGVIRLTVGKESADYFVSVIPADFGRGFQLVKVGIDASGEYSVNIDGDKRSCECKGFGRHGHCKHADGLAALIAAGKL